MKTYILFGMLIVFCGVLDAQKFELIYEKTVPGPPKRNFGYYKFKDEHGNQSFALVDLPEYNAEYKTKFGPRVVVQTINQDTSLLTQSSYQYDRTTLSLLGEIERDLSPLNKYSQQQLNEEGLRGFLNGIKNKGVESKHASHKLTENMHAVDLLREHGLIHQGVEILEGTHYLSAIDFWSQNVLSEGLHGSSGADVQAGVSRLKAQVSDEKYQQENRAFVPDFTEKKKNLINLVLKD